MCCHLGYWPSFPQHSYVQCNHLIFVASPYLKLEEQQGRDKEEKIKRLRDQYILQLQKEDTTKVEVQRLRFANLSPEKG